MKRAARAASVVSFLGAAAVGAWLAASHATPWFRLYAAAAAVQAPDTDGDTMADAWETFFGLDPDDPGDAGADPDGDGLTNAQEYAARRHPLGRHPRYFAEGSTTFRVRNYDGVSDITAFVTGINTLGAGTVDPFGFQLAGANVFTGVAAACPQ